MATFYGVLIVSYKTAAIKRAVESGKRVTLGSDPENYSMEKAYFGEDEADAK